MAFFGVISSSSGLVDRESESLSGSLQACSSSFFDWWKFYFRLVGWVAWEAETLGLLWSLVVEVETLQPCMKTCKIHQQFVLVWWKTFNGEHSDLNNSIDASTDYLNIASTFLAASMKFHQSNIIFNYSLCYAWWPWKPESRYIHQIFRLSRRRPFPRGFVRNVKAGRIWNWKLAANMKVICRLSGSTQPTPQSQTLKFIGYETGSAGFGEKL